MKLHGKAVSKGIAAGKILVYKPLEVTAEEKYCKPQEAQGQWEKYLTAKSGTEEELKKLAGALETKDREKAEIIMAHEEILKDVSLNEELEHGIRALGWEGGFAIQKVFGQYEELLSTSDVPMMQERKDDLKDVKQRLLRTWFGIRRQDLSCLDGPVMIAAHDLLPSDTVTLDRENVLGLITEVGGSTSHTAIVARSYGIPAVLGISELLKNVSSGDMAALDAENGVLIIDPSTEEIADFSARRENWILRNKQSEKYLNREPLTADGVRIDIGLNIEVPDAAELQRSVYADFVGLFRTEFIYMGHAQLPAEEEQYRIYKNVLEHFKGKPVTLRTLDIGGDKTAACLPLPKEENPFLGNRALRFCFSQPQIFRTQLRAALRASVFGELWLMLPMVGSIDDIRRAKEIIEEVKSELSGEGIPVADSLKIGIMVEIPAIALVSDMAATEVDFASIGTNDLCQYLMAADRQNPAVEAYYQSCHPAVFRVIGQVVNAFRAAGKPVSVCGEMGGDPLMTKVLIGLGLRKLSMNVASVAAVKEALAETTIEGAERLASRVKSLPMAGEICELLK